MDASNVFMPCCEGYLALICAVISIVFIGWFIRDSLKLDSFHTKHVFITGCDSGFGNLLAKSLDRKGFNVIAACLTEQGASQLSSGASRRLKTVLLDVTNAESVRRAGEFVSAEVGERGLWGLVNNAGRSLPLGPTDWLQLADFTKVLDVNLTAVIGVTLELLPLLKRARGRVVNVASVLGRVAILGGGYSISKYGVECFSDILRMEMSHFGIKVSILEPGFFQTAVTRHDLMEENLRALWDRLPQDVREAYGPKYVEQYLKYQKFNLWLMCSPDLTKVTSRMEHALTARYPRTRYAVGWDARTFWLPLSYCPTVVADFFLVRLFPTPRAV
ncbi:retinol dehydrogenase 1 [Gadus morhua]|uniref:Retinol dehydrogenase 1 n=2 Tax=Gadus morhua TaxID=8049 RepID=A0A8C5CXM0_GADMO|nr:dehydrogenase/reductase SDR family member 9 [Gadus morhua]